jgi:CBS domain-containing protein
MTETVSTILERKGSQAYALPPEASVFDAIALMADKGIGALLVIRGSDLVGIFSERDYARKVILKGKHSRETPLEEIMTSDVLTVTPEDTIDDCMRIMTEKRIRHLPVLAGGQVAGVISIGDIIRAIIAAQEETIHQLHNYIAGAYPG